MCRETEPDWDKEIGDDVKEECSKYGSVLHSHVDRNSKVRPPSAGIGSCKRHRDGDSHW